MLKAFIMFTADPSPLEIEVLVLPDTTLILVAAVIEPLRAANRVLGRAQFRWVLTTPDGAPAPTRSGIPIPAARPFDPLASGAPLVVAGSYDIAAHMTAGLVRRLGRAGRARPMIGGVEAGAWVVARAGLLTGRRATTHWEDLEDFTAAFPDIDVVPRRFVLDGNRFTSGGAGPTLDLMLELIRVRLGYPLSLEVAKLFTYEQSAENPGRVDQAPALTLARPREPHLARAVEAMEAHLDEPWPITRIAHFAGVSARHLQTQFRAHFGTSPYAHYQALRLNRARRLLIETRRPALEIAELTGFASPASFARAYRRQHGESPRETRAMARR
ncbi:MAG TPA: GlxA family transcriptional regulator [Thermohalobaculum sp.]|nr:GlxA family transcriptional regulator [Thermohalobaculum sp.]